MSVADPIAALVALLAADAEIVAQAGTRVFGGELPAREAASMPRAALVVRPSGGASLTSGSYAEHDAQRVDLYAYGATPAEASTLIAAAALVLRRVNRAVWASTLVHSCRSAGGFISGREPDSQWPRAWQSFQIFLALEKVS